MPDETGTETTRSDAPSADESLFGDAADDTAAAVAEEQDANKEAEQDPEGADDAGGEAGASETDTPDDLKVVVSIKGGRATIGVQQPSSDPHIESFDGQGPDRAGTGGPGGGRKGESQVGGRTEAPGSRQTRSPGQAPDPESAGVGAGCDRRGRGRGGTATDAEAVLRGGRRRTLERNATGAVTVSIRWLSLPAHVCGPFCVSCLPVVRACMRAFFVATRFSRAVACPTCPSLVLLPAPWPVGCAWARVAPAFLRGQHVSESQALGQVL